MATISGHRRRQSSVSASRPPNSIDLRQPADPFVKSNFYEDAGAIDQKSSDKTPNPASGRRISGSQASKLEGIHNETQMSVNRWSKSTDSSVSMGLAGSPQDRRSSHVKRHSVGGTGLGSPFGSNTTTTSPSRKRRSSDLQSSSPSKSLMNSFGSSISPLSFETLPPITLPLFTSTSTAETSPGSPDQNARNQRQVWSPSRDIINTRSPVPAYLNHSPIKQSLENGLFRNNAITPTYDNTERNPQEEAYRIKTESNQRPADTMSTSKSHSTVTSPPRQARHRTYSSKQSNGSGESDMTTTIRPKSRREKEKKAMLSSALRRANEAVILDNDQEYMRALEAYQEACTFLEKVINKSSTDEDKRKLIDIRSTYVERIDELRIQEFGVNALQAEAAMPMHLNSGHRAQLSISKSIDESPIADALDLQPHSSFKPGGLSNLDVSSPSGTLTQSSALSPAGNADSQHVAPFTLAPALEFAPKPLSPKPLSRRRSKETKTTQSRSRHVSNMSQTLPTRLMHEHLAHSRNLSNDSDDIFHKPGSPTSSHSSNHSISSVGGIHRKAFRQYNGDTEAEFDAALDAAVEAAYDDGYEPYLEPGAGLPPHHIVAPPPPIPNDIYKSFSADHTDREKVISEAKTRVAARQRTQRTFHLAADISDPESGGDSEEEERLLEEVTKGLFSEQPARPATAQPKSFPRQSDSSHSSGSGRTWGSSVTSSLNTATTLLSPVDENKIAAPKPVSATTALGGPPSVGPPMLPPPVPSKSPSASPKPSRIDLVSRVSSPNLAVQHTSVQDRRGSNQKAKRLKIETAPIKSGLASSGSDQALASKSSMSQTSHESLVPPRTAPGDIETEQRRREERYSLAPLSPSKLRFITSPFPSPLPPIHSNGSSSTLMSPPTPALSSAVSNDSSIRPSPQSPGHPPLGKSEKPALHKNISNLSLKNKTHLASDTPETSPGTPMSFTAHSFAPMKHRVPMNTPVVGSFAASVHRQQARMDLLGNDLQADAMPALSPYSPIYDNAAEGPRPLEPCPEHYLLRPFWVLRCIYQTIAHPRGGYITKKLFIPREVWKVKNVKLRGLEEKTAVCDHLTAALLKLASVNTLDADAVLEEMQALESVLDQAQISLSKKLGHDVGVNGISSFFKDAPVPTTAPTPTSATSAEGQSHTLSGGGGVAGGAGAHTSGDGSGTTKTGSKSYLSSWRKLRTKGSSTALSSSYITTKETPKETLVMATVPMTTSSAPPVRFKTGDHKETLNPEGPNAGYMGAMARLCDAAQIVDQIARQVEDPGLKHSSPTHVGLELSTRHAAEFFAFYICRFALQDITMLADKFVKRASEWVLS